MPGPLDYGKMMGLLGSLVQPVADPVWNKKQGILGGLGTEGARSRYSGGGEVGFTGVKPTQIGPGNTWYWAYHNGDMLRAKNGVGRNFKTPEAAEKALAEYLKRNK
jgi:hypothetical protein